MQRLNNLQGLRAIAFLLIFLSHCGIGKAARWSVTCFFVLSGFLMVYNHFSKNNEECSIKKNILFSYKKINRLYALHLVMLLPVMALIVYGALKDGILDSAFVIKQSLILLTNASLVQAWIPARDFYFGYNGVAWFLSVCTCLYFLFPFILKRLKNNWSCKKAVFSMVGCFLLQCAFSVFVNVVNCDWITAHNKYLVYIFPLYRLLDFVIGCNLGFLFLHSSCKSGLSNIKITIQETLSLLIVIGLPLALGFLGLGDIVYSAKDIPGVVCLVYVLGFNKGILSKLLSTKVLTTLGNMSVYTFLIHQVVINLVQSIASNKYIVAFCALSITLAGAFAYDKFDEIVRKRKGGSE